MALFAPVVASSLALEDRDLPGAALARDRAHHAGARDERTADARLAFPADHEHLIEGHLLPDRSGQLLHPHRAARCEPHLLPAGAHHRVHHESSAKRPSIGDSPFASTGWTSAPSLATASALAATGATSSPAGAATSSAAGARTSAAGRALLPLPPSQDTSNATGLASPSAVISNCSWWRSARARTSTSRPSRVSSASSIGRAGPSSCSATRRETVTASFRPPKRGRSFWISRSTLCATLSSESTLHLPS